MKLKTHIYHAVAADPRLQRLIGRDLTPEINWEQVAEDAGDGALSSGEAALVQCLASLAGVAIEHFDVHFERMDGWDQDIVRDIITAATGETLQAEAIVVGGR